MPSVLSGTYSPGGTARSPQPRNDRRKQSENNENLQGKPDFLATVSQFPCENLSRCFGLEDQRRRGVRFAVEMPLVAPYLEQLKRVFLGEIVSTILCRRRHRLPCSSFQTLQPRAHRHGCASPIE